MPPSLTSPFAHRDLLGQLFKRDILLRYRLVMQNLTWKAKGKA